MKRSKMTIALTLVVVILTALLASCGGTSAPAENSNSSQPTASASGNSPTALPPQPTPPAEGTKYADGFVYLMEAAIGTMNVQAPAGNGPGNNNANRMVFDTLYCLNPDSTISPMLATSYETEDYQTWIFHLRDDVYFHNGDKFTAKDVVYTWSSSRDKLGSPSIDNWSYVENATVVDDYTVKFELFYPYVDYLFHVSTPQTIILNERAISADSEKGYWIGTGAYKIVEFVSGDYIVFERNDDYWGELPYTRTQKWWFIPEQSSRSIMLKNGEAQVCTSIAITEVPGFEADPKYKNMQVTQQNVVGILFNTKAKFTSDLNFRKAVQYAIDREELAFLARGQYIEIVDDGTVWGLITPYRDTSIPSIKQDLDKAKEYLAASNYDGSPIEYVTTSGPAGGEALQAQLAKIGINLKINAMDMASYGAYTTYGNNQAQIIGSAVFLDTNPSSVYKKNFYPGMATNKYEYDNPEMNELIDASVYVQGEAERKEIFYKMQGIVAEDVPAIPLYYAVSNIVSVTEFDGLVASAAWNLDFRYAYVAEK